MRALLVVLLLAGTLPVAAAAQANHKSSTPAHESGGVAIDANAAILLAPDAPAPVRHAADDLASDFQAVMGKRPRIVTGWEGAAPVTILVEEQSKIPEALRGEELADAESFSISVKGDVRDKGRARTVVVLTGPDMRGTMYALYQFSQDFLGVDPLYYWTDHAPPHRASVTIPAGFSKKFSAPVFKYRGFFINDEDMLTGWAPGENLPDQKEKTGISLAVWNKIYETSLRLHANMIAPGTWIFPDDPQVKLAAERGLIVTQHHAIPLGLNVARWPKDVPYNYTEHPEILEQAWKNAVSEYLPNQEVIWSVGLRGLSDVTYAAMDPSVRDNNKALGQLISKAFADQIGIVKAQHPDAKFVTNLWQEGAKLVQSGDLKIPADVMTVWADDGYGWIQDHGEVAAGQGTYEHIAMMNGRANQLTEMVPIERSYEEIGRYIKAKATSYYLVNTSDIRPVTMSTRAVMDAVWKGLPASDDEFYKQWSAEEFGKRAEAPLTELYKQYFAAAAHSGDPVHEYGDQLYHTEARRMMLTYMTDSPLYAIPSQSPKWQPARILEPRPSWPGFTVGKEFLDQATKRDIEECGPAQARWDAVWKKAKAIEPLIPADRLPFYRSEVLAMIAINRQSNQILYLIAKSITDARAGNKTQAKQEANEALAAFDEIQRAESAAEYGKWKNWYRGDWLTGIYRTREMVQVFAKFLDDPLTHIDPPVLWDGWEAYYHIMHYEGDRSAEVK